MPAVRSTRQRSAVAGLLDELEDFHSAQDIHDLLKKRGEPIGLTTVYRTCPDCHARARPGANRLAQGKGRSSTVSNRRARTTARRS